jgi:hypothetical protein
MNEPRAAFLAAAATARTVVALPEVGDRWLEPSALAEMTVAALTAHLVRAVTNVDRFLEAPAPDPSVGEPVSGAAYFVPVTADPASLINVRVRTASAEEAVIGHRALLGGLDRALDRLHTRLPAAPEDRLLLARDTPIRLDDYLPTRLIELTTHTDDLCVSLGRETPTLPGIDLAIAALLEVATLRHGQLAVLRALARRERDAAQALRVL